MKILFLSDDFWPHSEGGAADVALNIARGMRDRGYEVSIITAVRNESDAGVRELEGMTIYSFVSNYPEKWRAYRSLHNWKATRFVKEVLGKIKPDVVHAHNIHRYISYASLKYAHRSGAIVVLTAHDCMLFHYGKFMEFYDPNDISIRNEYDYRISPLYQLRTFKWRYNPQRNFMIRYYLRYVHRICAVSNELKKALKANYIKDVAVVHNAIDLARWKIDPTKVQAFENEYGLNGFKRVLFVGRLTKAKGGEQLIQAMALVKTKIANLALIIAGQKDEYTESLAREAEGNGIKVVMTGWLGHDDLPTAYGASDLVAFPSICFDTFGMVNLEAMASRKPVISTCFGGSKEIIIDGASGYIVNPYDINKFSERIATLLNDEEMSKRFGDAGFDRAKEIFNLGRQLDDYERVYISAKYGK